MTVPVDHRTSILASIRRSLGNTQAQPDIEAEYKEIVRTYRRSDTLDAEARVEFFEHRLKEYEAGVYRSMPDSIATAIADILANRDKKSLAIPIGIPSSWLPLNIVFEEILEADAHQLDRAEGVLTGCTVAIAETGSIVLQNADAQGARMLSLVPDYHLCVVFAHQIVSQVPEAFDRLHDTSRLPTTFISGPSATADIEMTRIKGVHGPRFLDVLIVDDIASAIAEN